MNENEKVFLQKHKNEIEFLDQLDKKLNKISIVRIMIFLFFFTYSILMVMLFEVENKSIGEYNIYVFYILPSRLYFSVAIIWYLFMFKERKLMTNVIRSTSLVIFFHVIMILVFFGYYFSTIRPLSMFIILLYVIVQTILGILFIKNLFIFYRLLKIYGEV